jgi:hypothetical protein
MTQSTNQAKGKAAAAAPAKDQAAKDHEDLVRVEMVTRLPRRIRAGVLVTQEPDEFEVTAEQLQMLKADPHIKVQEL